MGRIGCGPFLYDPDDIFLRTACIISETDFAHAVASLRLVERVRANDQMYEWKYSIRSPWSFCAGGIGAPGGLLKVSPPSSYTPILWQDYASLPVRTAVAWAVVVRNPPADSDPRSDWLFCGLA